MIIALLMTVVYGAWAQTDFGNLPETVNASDATITKMGHLTMTMGKEVVVDPLTHQSDTIVKVKKLDWGTESGTAQKRMARRRVTAYGSGFENPDEDWWLDMWWYTYKYPSVNADGEPVTLSAMACMPDEDCKHINNVIIGCHVTITSNKECPSRYSEEGKSTSDVSMLMNHAGSGLAFHSTQGNMPYYNLVILPDYEGYGVTRNHAHPYLYQELTARQVVDATRYGISLYKMDEMVKKARHSFRDGWRSICVGYSQGGSVALATQRFIEQNGLTDELQFAGSVCGDGPYDMMATLMYYVKQYKEGDNLSMPVVLPLIIKGMCDNNPYMVDHQQSAFSDENLGWTTPDGWSYFSNIKGTNDYEEEWGLGISTLLALNSFRERVNSGEDFTGKIVKLEADIDMTTQEWDSGIGGGGSTFGKFSGTFDGQGHTVSNLGINIQEHDNIIQGLGFFYRVYHATIKDLRIDNFKIISQSSFTQAGGIVSALSSDSHFSNIYVSNSRITVVGHAGGLVGWDTHSDFNKCVSDKTTAIHGKDNGDDGNRGNGGLVGFAQSSTITNCAVINQKNPTSEENTCIKGPFVGKGSATTIDYCYTDAEHFEKFVPSASSGYTHGSHVVVYGQDVYNPWMRAEAPIHTAQIKNFMFLVSVLGLENWVYCVGEYPLPDCFEDRYPVEVNKFSLRPATLTTPRPNALTPTVDIAENDWKLGYYRNASFTTSSLWFDDNLNYGDFEQLPIGTATIECTNGVRYDRTLTAPENGTRTIVSPVYQTDEDGTIVLDKNGRRIPTGETMEVEETVYQPTPYSFCLPYELTFSNGLHLYTPGSWDRKNDNEIHVTFNETEDNVAQAWTPYYALVDAAIISLSTEEPVTLTPNPHTTIEMGGKFLFEGTDATIDRVRTVVTPEDETITKDAYLLQSDKTWRKEGDKILPFRAYFYSTDETQTDDLFSLVALELYNNSANSRSIVRHHGMTTDAILRGRNLIRDNSWNTLCLPFDVPDISSTPFAGATVMTLSSSSFDAKTGTLTLDFNKVTSIEAGKPYIMRWTTPDKDIKSPVFTDVMINSEVKNIKTDAVTFCGIFDPLRMVANDRTKLYMGDYNTLYYPKEEVTVYSFRAYFQLADGIIAGNPVNGEQSINTFVLNFDGLHSTGIVEAEDSLSSSEWFTVDGRKLVGKPTQKGIYINNGRSIVIK